MKNILDNWFMNPGEFVFGMWVGVSVGILIVIIALWILEANKK